MTFAVFAALNLAYAVVDLDGSGWTAARVVSVVAFWASFIAWSVARTRAGKTRLNPRGPHNQGEGEPGS